MVERKAAGSRITSAFCSDKRTGGAAFGAAVSIASGHRRIAVRRGKEHNVNICDSLMADEPCLYLAASHPAPAASTDALAAAPPTLQELFAAPGDAAAFGLVLSQLEPRAPRPLLWVQEARVLGEMGRVFAHGLPPGLRRPVLHVVARNARDALWAMEEGLKCPALSAVIGELHGNPRALDFTATRRLAVASERSGMPAFLLRSGGEADLSGARRRWRVASRPSLPHPHDAKAPGAPAWSLDLFRARDLRPGQWDVAYDPAAHRLDLVPATGDGTLAESASGYG